MNKRIHIYYSGSVQGVGFRFTTEQMAASLALTGWVKNLGDGRVEIVSEGQERVLKEFLEKIDSVFKRYIVSVDAEWSDASGEFKEFEVKF